MSRYLLSLALLLVSFSSFSQTPYRAGAGIADVTGVASGLAMMGYAQLSQVTEGIHSRLYARAFVIEDVLSKKRVVLVSADLGMIFESVRTGVLKELKEEFGDRYTEENVLLSATHTHSGPGGYAFHTLYNFTIGGFYRPQYKAVIEGIVEAIKKADHHLEPANLYLSYGELLNASRNRSISAYGKNPDSERNRYEHNTDKSMILLRIDAEDSHPIGMLNWFAVHGVSMSNENKLISGDNKGYASYLFEKEFNQAASDRPFVAAFMQANEGDSTPNIFGQRPDSNCNHFDCGDFKRTFTIGERQYQKARELYSLANEPLKGGLDYRFQRLEMNKQSVGDAKTCTAALGYSFAAGTTDGPGPDHFKQGALRSERLLNVIRNIIAAPTKQMEHCQSPKPIILAVGRNKPYSWVPEVLPIQLVKIDNLAIVAGPGEFTTMSGRRIKEAVLDVLKPEVDTVAFAGLANSYAGYVATFEEYQQQNYEGASTVFGPLTQKAYQEGFVTLANALKSGVEVELGPEPLDLSNNTGNVIPPVLFDDVAPGRAFGDVHKSPHQHYQPGDVVHASFWAGNPRNDLEKEKGFLSVERLEDGQWKKVYSDRDFNTIFHWQRVGISYAYANVYWKIGEHELPGEYRIKHHGHYLYGWNRKIYPYSGKTKPFRVG